MHVRAEGPWTYVQRPFGRTSIEKRPKKQSEKGIIYPREIRPYGSDFLFFSAESKYEAHKRVKNPTIPFAVSELIRIFAA